MLRFHQQHDSSSRYRGVLIVDRGHTFRWISVLLVVLVLASCSSGSDEPEDRQFANDPTKEQTQSSETPTVTVPPAPTEVETVPKASPSSVLKSRGAPDTIYSIDGTTITSVTLIDDRTTITSWTVENAIQILASDDSPDASHVAVIVESAEGASELVVFDSTGTIATTVPNLLDMSALSATPISDGTGGVTIPVFHVFVAWSPLGDQILVGASDGQLKSIPSAGGDAVVFAADTPLVGLESARWSPDGRAIGAVVRNGSGIGQLLTFNVDGADLTSSIAVGTENLPAKSSVEQFQWSVDGSSLLYVVVDRQGGGQTGGQLFELNLESNTPVLVATAGRGGPSGGIASFVPSPDGRSIAIVIAVLDGRTWTFHSLVVESLSGGTSYEVPAGGFNDVPGVWWISEGLVWSDKDPRDTTFILGRPDGTTEELTSDPANGTPVPAATPAT